MGRKHKSKNRNGRQPAYRKNLLKELEEKYPHYNLKSNFLNVLFLGGLCLTIWEIDIYRLTFIPLVIPLSIWVITGLATIPFMKNYFNIYCFNPYSPGYVPMVFHILFNIVSFGGIFIFLLMWLNYHYTNHQQKTIKAPIQLYGQLAETSKHCGNPYIEINYKGLEKKLIFLCGTQVKSYQLVYLKVEKGLFGYDIIKDQSLFNDQW